MLLHRQIIVTDEEALRYTLLKYYRLIPMYKNPIFKD